MGDRVLDVLQRPELLSMVLANMSDGMSIIDARGVQVYVNDALCKMLGFSREELLGASAPYPYWPAEELSAIEAAFQRTLRGDTENFELVFGRKDATRIEVVVSPATLRDESGNVIAYFATIKDVSDRKRLERSLMASEERWRSIAENPFDFVVLIDRDYRYTYVNHTAPGIDRESLIGKATPFDFVDAGNHALMRAAFESVFETGRAASYEVQVSQLDAWYASVVGPVIEHGEVTGLSILTREISEQRRAEAALKRSEQRLRDAHKMETIGTLAGGIAHDINNTLTPIFAYADLARLAMSPEHKAQKHLQGIRLAGERARKLVQRILLFSRKQEPHKTVFDLRQSVLEDITLLRASLPASIELVIALPEQPVHVFADRAQLGQVLTNLATNALQAMHPLGGELRIALERGGESEALLFVGDSGPGMDAETLRRAFDPFFTTKPVGTGTGLGLSIVHSVVREHGGETTVRSAPGEGAVFTIRLPTTTDQPPQPSRVASDRPMARSSVRVLLVDDEPAIVVVAREALAGAGHVVTAAASARAAFEVFVRDPDAFDVILTDQAMPGMTGTALIAEVRALRPAIACLLMTGHGDESTHRDAQALNVVEIIAKPFSISALLAAIERRADGM